MLYFINYLQNYKVEDENVHNIPDIQHQVLLLIYYRRLLYYI